MFTIILKSLYYFLPAYFAVLTPLLLQKTKFLNKPIHQKFFGKNKTWKGIISATLIGTLIFFIQKLLYIKQVITFSIIDYNGFSILLGFVLALGTVFGELVKSYYKRKRKTKPGKSWPVWDQSAFTIGALVLSSFIYTPPPETILILLIISPFIYLLFTYLLYLIKISKNKF